MVTIAMANYRNGNYDYPNNNRDDNRYPSDGGDVYAGNYGDDYPDYGYNGLNKSKSSAKRGPIRVK